MIKVDKNIFPKFVNESTRNIKKFTRYKVYIKKPRMIIDVLKKISKHTKVEYEDVEFIYDKLKSIDKTIKVIEFINRFAVSKEQAIEWLR